MKFFVLRENYEISEGLDDTEIFTTKFEIENYLNKKYRKDYNAVFTVNEQNQIVITPLEVGEGYEPYIDAFRWILIKYLN